MADGREDRWSDIVMVFGVVSASERADVFSPTRQRRCALDAKQSRVSGDRVKRYTLGRSSETSLNAGNGPARDRELSGKETFELT